MNRLASLAAAAALLAGANPATWFPPSQMTTVGVYYYPEAWPESQWARDIANIKKHGFEFIHMGEFAWYFMEPEEGKYRFDWLEKNVKLAADAGLKVVLCTPSATPPAWLVRKHPEVLMVNAQGRRMNHGSREQGDWSSPVYREYVTKINTELARRFGKNPAVWGWQIDNELSHYGAGASYTSAVTKRFREWLREKYGTIQSLNSDWGNAFWSQMYNSFDEIDPPNQAELVQQVNPHALLDFQRWFADDTADYIRMQAATLRKYSKDQWITTNYMGLFPPVDPARSVRDLDVFTWTHYPVHGNITQFGFRLGDPYLMSFVHDQMRSFNGLAGIMELQPGQVNWGDVNPWPEPGAIRMWIHRAFGAGAKLVCTYRYRQPIYGGELYHKGIVETDGVTLSRGGKEFVQAIQEIATLRKQYKSVSMPAELAARRTALLVKWDDMWDIDNHKQTARWNTTGHWLKYYRALKSMMAPVDILSEPSKLSGYPYVVAPAHQMMSKQTLQQLTAYAEGGGNLVLTVRSGHKDTRGHLWEAMWAEPIYDLIGASIPMYDLLPGNHVGTIKAAEREYRWGTWAEVLEPRKGTTILATYGDQFYSGKPAAITRKLGKGTVTYVGVDSLDGDFEQAILRQVYAPTKPANLASGLVVDWRDGFFVATNFAPVPQPAPASAKARFLIGGPQVPTAGVAVWTE